MICLKYVPSGYSATCITCGLTKGEHGPSGPVSGSRLRCPECGSSTYTTKVFHFTRTARRIPAGFLTECRNVRHCNIARQGKTGRGETMKEARADFATVNTEAEHRTP
jgi:hypothetical protein